jgi:Zn-dependent M28 family amino/carboxypeptidase
MPSKLRTLTIAVLIAALGLWAADIDPDRYLGEVKYLASPELKGRGTGTPGLEKAAKYIEKQFRAAGLQPLGGDYFQRFPVTTNARLGSHSRFEYAENGRKKTLKLQQDFVPFNFSASGRLSGRLVFAGYGITAPEYHYDDYAGLEVKDKIVVVLRHEPQENDEKSVFAGKLLTEHAQSWSKAVNAKRHGAAGVLLVADRANHRSDPDDVEKFGRAAGPINAGIPFVQVKAATVEEWFSATGKNLEQLAAGIDKDLKPRSFALPDSLQVSATVELKREVRTVRNVAGYLPGQTDEYVILGAHYDHLGLGEQYSLAPSQAGKPHLGADDNASGTAGVIELARWFGSQPKPKRGILFLAFAGEELGLLGSRYWVDHPELPLAKAVAMINLDMIGRLRDRKVYVGGARTGTTFKAVLEEILPKHRLKADLSGGMDVGSSDHTSFTSKQVPALFFFSGLHGDYHKPSDTWDKIDAPDAAELLRAVADIAGRLSSEAGRPEFVKVEPPKTGLAAGGGPGYGAWFGSVPDFGETPKGVKFADVTAGSPAAKAGLRGGDILIEFDGAPVQNLYDFTYALRAKKPGDEVVVKVLRGGETITAKVALGQRPR